MRQHVLTAVRQARQAPPEIRPHRQNRKARWQPKLAATIAAAAIGTAAVVAATALSIRLDKTEGQLSTAQAEARAISAVLSSPDARILARPTAAGGTTAVVVSAHRHAVVVTTGGLPRLADGKVYQLWLIGPPGTRSAGLLPEAVSGHAGPVLATGLDPGDKLGITVEPAGGTRQPTTTPILVLALP
jgi:uncharacterized membrane protein